MSKFKSGPLGIAGALTRAFIASSLTPLFVLAALAAGLVALGALPREEEPQISVPMVDIHVQAQGLRAEDAVKAYEKAIKLTGTREENPTLRSTDSTARTTGKTSDKNGPR